MLIKMFCLFVFGALMFTAGFFVGGISWEWSKNEYSLLVAFWSMVGGWVSGISTLLAVLVSLILAYQAVTKEQENIVIKMKSFKKSLFGDGWKISVVVRNLNNYHVEVTDVFLVFDPKNAAVNINELTGVGPFPKVLKRKGAHVDFSIKLDSGNEWWRIYDTLSQSEIYKFKKCKVIVVTEVGTHYYKLNSEVVSILNENYVKYLNLK